MNSKLTLNGHQRRWRPLFCRISHGSTPHLEDKAFEIIVFVYGQGGSILSHVSFDGRNIVRPIYRNAMMAVTHKVSLINLKDLNGLEAVLVKQLIDSPPALFIPVVLGVEIAAKMVVLADTADDFPQFDLVQAFVG